MRYAIVLSFSFFTTINPGDTGPLDIIRKACIKSNIRYTDELPYISKMSAIDVYDYVKHLTSIKFNDTIIKYIISLVFCILLFFNVCGVTLVTGHLQNIDHIKLSKTWVF